MLGSLSRCKDAILILEQELANKFARVFRLILGELLESLQERGSDVVLLEILANCEVRVKGVFCCDACHLSMFLNTRNY